MCPTFKFHADVHALLEPAVGTPLPLGLVNDATPLRHAGVDLLVLHGPLEEALAGLAGENAVVEPRDLVTTHLETQHEAADRLNNYRYSQSQPPFTHKSIIFCSIVSY